MATGVALAKTETEDAKIMSCNNVRTAIGRTLKTVALTARAVLAGVMDFQTMPVVSDTVPGNLSPLESEPFFHRQTIVFSILPPFLQDFGSSLDKVSDAIL